MTDRPRLTSEKGSLSEVDRHNPHLGLSTPPVRTSIFYFGTYRGRIEWSRRPFSFFNRVEPCPCCGAPLTVRQLLDVNAWEVVHGEVPLLCWPDEKLGDDLRLWDLYGEWFWVVICAHWDIDD